MARCDYCNQEMLAADGCTDAPIIIDGDSYPPLRYGSEPGFRGVRRRCGDCGVLPGRVHHHGCDVERCPACFDQSIGCECVWAGEEDLDDDWEEELEERFLLVGPEE